MLKKTRLLTQVLISYKTEETNQRRGLSASWSVAKLLNNLSNVSTTEIKITDCVTAAPPVRHWSTVLYISVFRLVNDLFWFLLFVNSLSPIKSGPIYDWSAGSGSSENPLVCIALGWVYLRNLCSTISQPIFHILLEVLRNYLEPCGVFRISQIFLKLHSGLIYRFRVEVFRFMMTRFIVE